MDTRRDRLPRLGSKPSRPWVQWLLAVVCLGLGLTALLNTVFPFLPAEVALVSAGGRPAWAWLVVGLVLLAASVYFTWRAYRWKPPVLRQVSAENGLPVQLELGEGGGPGLISARLKHGAKIQEPLAAWKVELGGPPPHLSGPAGRSAAALAYFDLQTGLPTAVYVEDRVYRVQPGKASIVPAGSP